MGTQKNDHYFWNKKIAAILKKKRRRIATRWSATKNPENRPSTHKVLKNGLYFKKRWFKKRQIMGEWLPRWKASFFKMDVKKNLAILWFFGYRILKPILLHSQCLGSFFLDFFFLNATYVIQTRDYILLEYQHFPLFHYRTKFVFILNWFYLKSCVHQTAFPVLGISR